MALSLGKVTMSIVVDKPAVERAREYLAERLNGVIADPVLVAEVVEEIIRTAPVARWISTPFRECVDGPPIVTTDAPIEDAPPTDYDG